MKYSFLPFISGVLLFCHSLSLCLAVEKPRSWQYWAAQAETHSKAKEYDKAATAYLEAAKAYPDGGASSAKGRFYAFRAGVMYASLSQDDKALEWMGTNWPSLKPEWATYMDNTYGKLLYSSAEKALASGQYPQAIQRFEQFDRYFKDVSSRTPAKDQMPLHLRFSLMFYGVPTVQVSRELQSMTTPVDAVHVRLLHVVPDSYFRQPAFEEQLLRSLRIFTLLIRHLSKGKLQLHQEIVTVADADISSLIKLQTSTYKDTFGGSLNVLNVPAVSSGIRALFSKIVDLQKTGAIHTLDAATGAPLAFSDSEKGSLVDRYDTMGFYMIRPENTSVQPAASVMQRGMGKSRMMGLLSIPVTHIHLGGMLVHEYVHLLENRYGVTPKHGFSPTHGYTENTRKSFPDWTGNGQYSFFQYLFDKKFLAQDPALQKVTHP